MKNANPKILELIALFFISVDNDIYNWKIDTCLGHEIYKSKDYGDNAQFIIDTKKNELVLHSSYESILISKYCNIIFIIFPKFMGSCYPFDLKYRHRSHSRIIVIL